MNNHLDDADLMAIALLPDEAADSRIHLASCPDCNARMAIALSRLREIRREHDESIDGRDSTFWKAQELRIMREVTRARRPVRAGRGLAAAALLAVALGGFWVGRSSVEPSQPAAVAVAHSAASTSAAADDTRNPLIPVNGSSTDPWEIESLSEFQPVVDWESWVDENGKDQGTI